MKNYKRKIGIRKAQKMEVLPALLFLMAMILGSVYYSLLMEITQNKMIRNAAASAVMAAVFSYYLLFRNKGMKYKSYIFLVLFAASACSFWGLLYFDTTRFPIWVLGGMLMARFIKPSFAAFYTCGMLALSMLYYRLSFFELFTLALAGMILSWISGYLKEKAQVIYVCLIGISTQISILFITRRFVVKDIKMMDILLLISCVGGCIFFAYISGNVFDAMIQKREGNSDDFKECLEFIQMQSDPIALQRQKGEEETSIFTVVQDEYPLKQLLKVQAPRLYRHSGSVAALSRKAAAYLEADQELAYAGGWYHEIKRLFSESKEGVDEICGQYALPAKLVDVIRQQNYKEHTPSSIEAVIVLLSDQIISTQNYLDASKNTSISMDQIIENSFSSQLKRGAFDKAGITVAQYDKLKQFYLIELM